MELRELNNTYNGMITNMNDLIRVVYEKEVLQSRTELKALQAQINPHFLFNTLEAFNWSLEEKGEEELAGLVVVMSRLFRYIIGNPNMDEWVTLGEEVEQVRRYLQIMEMRMGERLTWNVELAPQAAAVPVPKLLIQPIAENAILHGVESRVGSGLVSVVVQPSLRQGWTTITVSDNGPGMDADTLQALYNSLEGGPSISSKGNGVGLVNVQRRLKLYYGRENADLQGMMIDSKPSQGTAISFEIPNNGDIPMSLGNKMILVVDDEPRTRQGIKQTLEVWAAGRYTVETADNGIEARERLLRERVHLLITDVRMPEVSGLDLIRSLEGRRVSRW